MKEIRSKMMLDCPLYPHVCHLLPWKPELLFYVAQNLWQRPPIQMMLQIIIYCNWSTNLRYVMYEIGLLASDTSMCGRTEIPMNVRRITKAHQKDTCQTGSHKGNNTVLKLPDLLLKYSKIGGGGGGGGESGMRIKR